MQGNQEIYEHIKKYSIILFWSLLAVTAKISSINKQKKVTKAQVLSTLATGVLCGFLSSFVCDYYKLDKNLTVIAISISALVGENITGFIIIKFSRKGMEEMLDKLILVMKGNKK